MADQIINALHDAKQAALMQLQSMQIEFSQVHERMMELQNMISYYQGLIADLDQKISIHDAEFQSRRVIEHNALSEALTNGGVVNVNNALAAPPSEDRSVKDMLVHILRGAPNGYDIRMILGLLKTVFGVDVPRTTVSPQLSRMKHNQILELVDDRWRLDPRYRDFLAHHVST